MPRLAQNRDIEKFELPPGPWPDGYDAVLQYDTFDAGFSGWQDHTEYQSGAIVGFPPISLSSQRTAYRSRHALMLSTSASRGSTSQLGGQAIAFKRDSRIHDDGFTAVFFLWTLRSVGEQTSPQWIKFDIDTQAWDETGRTYASLRLNRFVGAAPDTYAPKWTIRDGASQMDIPGAVPGNAVTPVEGSGSVFGWNENKAGFSWAGLVIKDDDWSDAYHRAYTGEGWHNLNTLGADSSDTPQNSEHSAGGTSFAGGKNYGASMLNRGATDDGPARLFIGAFVALHYPQGTVFPS